MGERKYCSNTDYHGLYSSVKMFRAYIRKYDYNGKAKWIPKGWICDECNTFVPDEKERDK